jgi:hypothetical protein
MSVVGSPADQDALGEEQLVTRSSKDEIVQLPPGIELTGCGVDTVSFAWRPQSERLWAHLEEPLERGGLLQGCDPESHELFAASEVMRGAGGAVLVKESIGGGRVGYYPQHRFIYIEGRLAALYAGDAKAPGLAPPWQLENASCLSALRVSDLLYPSSILFEKCSVRRIDLSADIHFTEPSQGLRLLKALSSIECAPLKTCPYFKNGRVETINYRTPVRGAIRARIYDKGLQSGAIRRGEAAPGERLRLETQNRYVGAQQPAPARLARAGLGRMWQGRLKGWEATENVVVADLNAMQRVILDAVTAERLSAFTAERLLGTLALRGRGMGKDWWTAQGKEHLWGRRSRELRDLGLVLDEDGLGGDHKEDELPLGTVLRALRQAWPSGVPGQGRGN